MKVPAFCFKLIMVEHIGEYHEQIQHCKNRYMIFLYQIAAKRTQCKDVIYLILHWVEPVTVGETCLVIAKYPSFDIFLPILPPPHILEET